MDRAHTTIRNVLNTHIVAPLPADAQRAITAGHDQKVIIENRVGNFGSTSDGVLKLIEDAGEPNAGCILDLAHRHATKEHLDLVISKLKKRLMYMHLVDNDDSISHHLPAGRGNTNFPAIFPSLLNMGFDSYANVDYGGGPADQIPGEVQRGRQLFTRCLVEARPPTVDSVGSAPVSPVRTGNPPAGKADWLSR